MGYYNMIFQYNENKFLEKCKKSKVDGLIVVDLPYPENKSFADKCKKKGINFIQLVSPTTSEIRLKKIIKDSHDMIYYISMLSTTGGKLKVSPKKVPLKVIFFLFTTKGCVLYDGNEFVAIKAEFEYFFL